jgi:ribosomal protein L25 (general stress protein Ctc)
MKKALIVSIATSILAGCSTMKDIPDRKTYAQPSWYQSCAQEGVKGWFWWKEDYVYACGAGESIYAQAAEEQMYAIAMNNFAKRINGTVNSETVIDIKDDKKTTRTVISYKVDNTSIRKHVKTEKGHFTMNGRHYTYVRLEMKKSIFEQLIAEAKAQ